jgi:hypothetical protein
VDFSKFVDWAFKSAIAAGIGFGVSTATGMRTSLDELNAKLLVIIEKTTRNERDLDKHESRIHALETKGK